MIFIIIKYSHKRGEPMTRERNEKGRFTHAEGPLKDKLIGFRVTEAEFKAIKAMQKKGVNPRDIIVKAANKAIKPDE